MKEEAWSPEICACAHCGLPVEGCADEVLYCCSGCELAAQIVSEAGVEAWYAERESAAPRPERRPLPSLPIEKMPDGTASLSFRVQGIRCSSCVWLVERVLEATPGVSHVRVSYGTGRAELAFDPETVGSDTLLQRVQQLGYQPAPLGAEAPRDDSLLVRLGVSVFLAANIMLMAVSLYLGWLNALDAVPAALFRWASLLLSVPLALWAAEPFHSGAWRALKSGHLHMDLPISLAVTVLFLHGCWATFQGTEGYLDSLAMLVTLLLAGRVLDQRGRRAATQAAATLASSTPSRARALVDGQPVEMPAKELRPGMKVILSLGEELAADGIVLQGSGMVRTAQLTGESRPLPITVGQTLLAGSSLVQGNLVLRVERAGEQTRLAQMAQGLLQANDRPQAPDVMDRIAPWFTAGTLAVAALTAIGSALAGVPVLPPLIAVLVVACPCALSLARPLCSAVGLGRAADNGLLARSGDALLALDGVDVVVLDKTGTLTEGTPAVTQAEDHILRLAAGVERASIHPVAHAVLAACQERGIAIPLGTALCETPGFGMDGRVDGQAVRVQQDGPGRLMVYVDEQAAGCIHLKDRLRPEAAQTLAALQALGPQVQMLTGDHGDIAQEIAAQAGISQVFARATPEQKAEHIRGLQAQNKRVLFIGDGVNDGLALAQADVAVAMSTGAGSSVMVADCVIAWPSLAPLLAGMQAARAAKQATQKNLRRSIAYNILAVSAAAFGLVNPLVAAILMPLSSGMVLLGAARVRSQRQSS